MLVIGFYQVLLSSLYGLIIVDDLMKYEYRI
jgi:hypothetical protein